MKDVDLRVRLARPTDSSEQEVVEGEYSVRETRPVEDLKIQS